MLGVSESRVVVGMEVVALSSVVGVVDAATVGGVVTVLIGEEDGFVVMRLAVGAEVCLVVGLDVDPVVGEEVGSDVTGAEVGSGTGTEVTGAGVGSGAGA